MPRTIRISICLLVCLIFMSSGAYAEDFNLEALRNAHITNTGIASASIIPATDELPEHCLITGYIRPAIHFEAVLPTTEWNGKFFMTGCGGYCGQIGSNAWGLSRRYATSTMDSGHWGYAAWDGRWADHNRVAEEDWAHRAVHETARVTKELIEIFYGRTPETSYFFGCSTGGRMALMEAIRYPEDFDGIICGAPAIDYTATAGISTAWAIQANTDENGKNIIRPSDLEYIRNTVMERFDKVDGLEDGLIDDPRFFDFDPAAVFGHGGNSGKLSAEQIETLKKWYQGPRNSKGEKLFPGGSVPGAESHMKGWLTGDSDDVGDELYYLLARDFLRYMAFQNDPGDSYQVSDFDFDRDPPRLEHMANLYNSTNPDLDAFRERGGKLLIFHGWGDAGIPAWQTIDYYDTVEKRIGSREKTWESIRFFLFPGMGHCGGKGYEFDLLTAIEKWVEQGTPPETFRVTKRGDDGTVEWMRDLYPYPMRTVYKGEGDPADPASFMCQEPGQ